MSTIQEHDDFDNQVLSKIGEKLYLKTEKADVYFTFDITDERIPAHKLLLSSGSDVFHAMFYGSLKEEGDIRIVDASAEAFKEFLRFFYFNKVELSIENVAEVMYLAEKYNVEECLRLCTKLLTTNITCSETEVFEACMSWVRSASKQKQLTKDIIQTHLGDLFYTIRFCSMSMDEFVKLVPKYGNLFSEDEYSEILQVITQEDYQPKLFKGCRRLRFAWDDNNVIECSRYEHFLGNLYNIQSEEITTFSTNKTLLLGNFVCAPLFETFNRIVKTAKIIATIQINSNRSQTQFRFDYEYNVRGFTVKLADPILIHPEIRYEIRLILPSTQYYALRQLEPTVNLQNDIVVHGVIFELGFNLLE